MRQKLKRVGIFTGIMNKSLVVAIILYGFSGCQKTDISDLDPKSSIDQDMLVNKNWYLGGKQTPQLFTLRFEPDHTVLLTKCVGILPPYRYETQAWPWSLTGKDSVALYTSRFRIYSMSDSVLVTSSWSIGGRNDSIPQMYRTY
jgi:hypothetical protein